MAFLFPAALFLLLLAALLPASARFRFADARWLESVAIGALLWLGGFALIVWLLGSAGVIISSWWLIAALVIVALESSRRDTPRQLMRAGADWWRRLDVLERWLSVYLGAIFTLTFVLNLAPPGANDYDSLMYHLAAPRQYLRAGRIVELSYDHHSYFPFLWEMLYLSALKTFPADIFAGAVFAKCFHWLMLPISCALLIAIGTRHLSRRAGILAACLFASIPFVPSEATTAYIDIALSALVLAQCGAFLNWLQTRQSHWLVLSGALGGLSIGVKYLGVLFCVVLGAWLVGDMIARRRFDAKSLGRFALPILILGGGWYARNWAWTGNPVFPFAYPIFGGRGWSTDLHLEYTTEYLRFGWGRSLLDALLLPLRVSMTPLNAIMEIGTPPAPFLVPQPLWPWPGVASPGDSRALFEVRGQYTQTVLGPMLLIFGAPLLFKRAKPFAVKFCLGATLFFGVFWFFNGQYLRYALPALALLCVPCGWMAGQCLGRSAILKWTSALALIAWLLFVPALKWHEARGSLGVLSGAQKPRDWVEDFSGYRAMKWANANLPATARVAVWGEARTFYLERDYFWADDFHNNLIDYSRISTGDDLRRALKQRGAGHVLWNQKAKFNGGGFDAPPILQRALDEGALELLYPDEERGYRVCRVR